MSVPVPGLKVTVDVETSEGYCEATEAPNNDSPIFCSCQSEYCDCGSTLGVTETTALKVYKHFGFPNKHDDVLSQDYRPNSLHIWGTHNLSTEDVLSWLSDYNPQSIEWINDASCNVVFLDENTVLRVIVDFAEPFDRRVALAAAAALVSFVKQNDAVDNDQDVDMTSSESGNSKETQLPVSATGLDSTQSTNVSQAQDENTKCVKISSGALSSIEQFSQYLPPTGRWYKALSVPSQTISLFLRFAHKSDVKQPGAERRSAYYRRFGNPNYGGMTGILTRSYRRRLRTSRQIATGDPNGDLRHIRVFPNNFAELIADVYEDPDSDLTTQGERNDFFKGNQGLWSTNLTETAPERPLIVYDNLYNDDEEPQSYGYGTMTGQRRSAKEFPVPKPHRQPRKWPRRDSGPAPNRWFPSKGGGDDDNNIMSDDDDDDFIKSPEPGSIVVLDPREPWSLDNVISDPKPFIFTGKPVCKDRKLMNRFSNPRKPIATVTLMPDTDTTKGASFRSYRPLTSMTMVADLETQNSKTRHITDRLGFSRSRLPSSSDIQYNRFHPKSHQGYRNSPNVWQRLG